MKRIIFCCTILIAFCITISCKKDKADPGITSILIKTQPSTLFYNLGDKLDLTGLVVTLTYENGVSIDVEYPDFDKNNIHCSKSSGSVITELSPVVITHILSGAKVNLNITLIQPTEISINTPPLNSKYYIEDIVDLTGLTVKIKNNNGSEEIVNLPDFQGKGLDCSIKNGDTIKLNTKKIVIKHNSSGKEAVLPLYIKKTVIVFERRLKNMGQPNIAMFHSDSSSILNLTQLEAGGNQPSVSPDGKHIAFVLSDGNQEDIYIIDIDGKNLVRLTDNPANDFGPSWSPDGKNIAYSTYMYSWPADIAIINIETRSIKRITSTSGADLNPNWSPDGKKLLFSTNTNGNFETTVIDTSGQNMINLTNNPSYDETGEWSPDGSKIVFVSNRDGDNEIYTMNPDGSHVVQLTSNNVSDSNPRWSLDGSKIIYSSLYKKGWEIFMMNSNGSKSKEVFSTDNDCRQPALVQFE